MYRGIPVHALGMVEDIVMIVKCNTVEAINGNIKTNFFVKSKKLECQTGCQWVNIGKHPCDSSYIIDGKSLFEAKVIRILEIIYLTVGILCT